MTATESRPESDPEAGSSPAIDPDLEFDVPLDASAVECPHCGRPFVDERQRDLHVGLEHGDAADDAERTAFGDAIEIEREDLRLFRLKALAVLVLLYFGLLFTYSIVT
ncbi:MAG TPA: hypothetical protein VJ898_10630 [Natrialbaceae archaeon]|nr:hypothetical protein [Natrialbaceae archaeon]